MKDFLPTVLALSLLFGFGYYVRSCFSDEAGFTASELSDLATEANKSLPMRLNEGMETTSIMAMGANLLVYSVRYLGVDTEAVEPAELNALISTQKVEADPFLRNFNCSTPNTRTGILEQGVTIRYRFYDELGVFLYESDISLEDCQ